MKCLQIILIVISMHIIGCGGPADPMGTLSGVVTFDGNPVTEGEVGITSSSAQFSAVGAIESDGDYYITSYKGGLPPGDYQVYIVPPMVKQKDSKDSPGGEWYKEMDSIPEKYRSTKTSGLSVTIVEGGNQLDIQMTMN